MASICWFLGRPDSEDFFIRRDGDSGIQSSLKAAARKLLGEMPAAGREVYELQYGIEAKDLLEKAVASRNIQQLIEIGRRF